MEKPPDGCGGIHASFSSLQRAPEGSIGVRLIPGAGRGVVALCDIPKGSIVFEEDPYIMIPMANRRRLAVCLCCGEQVVDRDRLNKAIEVGDDTQSDDMTNSSFASGAVAECVSSSGGVMCEGGCGECYCSLDCRDAFHHTHHIDTGICAALKLCRPAMNKLNTADYNHLRALVAFGMKAKSEGVGGGSLADEDLHHDNGSDASDCSITEDSDWEDLPNWKRRKLIAERKEERRAAREAAGTNGKGAILPVHIRGIQSAINDTHFDHMLSTVPVIDVLEEEEPDDVTRRRARHQGSVAAEGRQPKGEPNKRQGKGHPAPVSDALEVVCNELVAAQMTTSGSGGPAKLDDYYLSVDIQRPPRHPTFATAIAPLVTNYSDFSEEQLDSFRDVYNAYCDLFPQEGSDGDEEAGSSGTDTDEGEAAETGTPDKKVVTSIRDVVDMESLPVYSEYMFLKISAAFQCNGFSIYNTSLRRTNDRKVGIGRKNVHSHPASHRLAPSADSGTVSPYSPPIGAEQIDCEPLPPAIPDRVEEEPRPALLRDQELLTGVYGYAAYFNHACSPNIKKTFGGPWGRTLQFVALKDISPGEQVCISYCGDAGAVGSQEHGGANLRRWRLQKQYYFLCCCDLCERKKNK